MNATKLAAKYRGRYPWEEWFAASADEEIALVRGRDFRDSIEPVSMANLFRSKMSAAGVLRTVKIRGDHVLVGPKSDYRGKRKEIG